MLRRPVNINRGNSFNDRSRNPPTSPIITYVPDVRLGGPKLKTKGVNQ